MNLRDAVREARRLGITVFKNRAGETVFKLPGEKSARCCTSRKDVARDAVILIRKAQQRRGEVA
jgi:hypothetical protein